MFLSGALADFPPAEVLQLLSFSMQTGVLSFHGGATRGVPADSTPETREFPGEVGSGVAPFSPEVSSASFQRRDTCHATGRLWFHMGELYCAESGSGPSLEDRLATRGAVSRGQWGDAVRRAGGQFDVGAELVRTSMASDDELRTVLHHTVCCAVLDLLRTRSGRFEFEAGPRHVVGPVATFTVDGVVTQVRQRLDEVDAVARVVSPQGRVGVVAHLATGTVEVVLSPRQWALVAAAGAAPSVRDLARQLGRGQYDTARAVHELVERGLLTLDEPETEPEPEPEPGSEPADTSEPGPRRRLIDAARRVVRRNRGP